MKYKKTKKMLEQEKALKALGVDYEFIEHEEIKTVKEGLEFLEIQPKEGVSSLLMKSGDNYFMVLRRDDHKIDNKKLKKVLGVSELKMATPEEIREKLDCGVGYVSLYNSGFEYLVDESVFEVKYIYGGTGSPNYDLKIKPEDLLKLVKGKKVNIAGSLIDYGFTKKDSRQMKIKKRVLSGIRATGRLHLGNYLGMVKGMLELQDNPQYEVFYMVADLHSLTTPYDKEKLAKTAREVVLDYLACGLNPQKSAVFLQSHLSAEHTELMYYFSTVTTIARMQHLPTFKDKVKQYPQNATMALLNYPILMAADILIYKATDVPVGIDQEPHLEISRETARKMNSQYGMDFPEPQRFATKTGYVPSLTGEGKMSKTVEGSYINLTDSLEEIKEELSQAPTDSGKGAETPKGGGVANLLTLVELFEGKEKRKQYEKDYEGKGIRYGDLKKELAEAIFKELKPIQKKRQELEAKPDYVEKVIEAGVGKARKIAQETIKEVKEKMGLL